MAVTGFLCVFEMVYWADIIYEGPLDSMEKDKESEFYIEEPISSRPRVFSEETK